GAGSAWVAVLDPDSSGLRVRHARALATADEPQQAPLLLVLERDADALMLLANEAVLRLMGASLLAFMIVAGVILTFAWLLSQRIRSLQRRATRAVAADGRVLEVPVPARGSDELAQLSRSVSRLLERLRGHQQYLRTLADKLAHELRTPLAMIDSSLDNLQARLDQPGTFDPGPARTLIDRAGEGSRRLNRILRAMSEAARLEDALIDEPMQRFDLAAMVADYCREFSAAHDQRLPGPLHFDRPPGPIMIEGSPDLIAQLLDKLLDNAIDFTPADGEIRVSVRDQRGGALLEVDNTGPAIDAEAAATLFEPMVSLRPGRSGRSHLGLGLFIARLIAERHHGRLTAEPLPDGSRFRLELP
ncbi:MAG: ATP-binding protein, partial [Wenzhouxiangellaceae bacterium]